MSHFYAQVRDGVVVAVTQTSAPVDAADMVPIESYDLTLMGASYADGVFIPSDAPTA